MGHPSLGASAHRGRIRHWGLATVLALLAAGAARGTPPDALPTRLSEWASGTPRRISVERAPAALPVFALEDPSEASSSELETEAEEGPSVFPIAGPPAAPGRLYLPRRLDQNPVLREPAGEGIPRSLALGERAWALDVPATETPLFATAADGLRLRDIALSALYPGGF